MTSPTRQLVYIDTETTGLDPFRHEPYEVSWAVGDGEIHTSLLPHSLDKADPKALEISHYWHRGFIAHTPVSHLKSDLTNATLVGSNPAFDSVMLQKSLGQMLWHYRLIDVENMAATVFDWDELKGLNSIRDHLAELGHDIPEPTHRSADDVATTRGVHKALIAERTKLEIEDCWCGHNCGHPNAHEDNPPNVTLDVPGLDALTRQIHRWICGLGPKCGAAAACKDVSLMVASRSKAESLIAEGIINVRRPMSHCSCGHFWSVHGSTGCKAHNVRLGTPCKCGYANPRQ